MEENTVRIMLEYHPEDGPPSKYKVWNVINPPAKPLFLYVDCPETAKQIIEIMAIAQLCNPMIISNAFGLLELDEDGEWTEWYNEEGEDVFEAFPDIGPGGPNYED